MLTDPAVARRGSLVAGLFLALAVLPSMASAHPLGNFSVSHYTAIRIEPETIQLRYVLDLAEIPTFQEIQAASIVPEAGHPSLAPYLARTATTLAEGLALELNGRRLPLHVESTEVSFPPGAGGLPTMRIGVGYRAAGIDPAPANWLSYVDRNYAERAGFKEIIALAGEGVTLEASSVPERDQSRELSEYPSELIDAPPQVLEARVLYARGRPTLAATSTPALPRPSSGPGASIATALAASKNPDAAGHAADASVPASARPSQSSKPRDAFTELMTTRRISASVVLVALAVAASLGALHALEPGHGKTVVGAYLVGSRGTASHALALGLIVTASHTAGVYLVGAVALFASRYMVPERLYPWLGVTSGLVIAILGASLFLRRYAARDAHADHDHHHDDGEATHAHGPGRHSHRHLPRGTVTLRELFALGISGGIVPCPAALVVLLAAVSLQRTAFGLLLIVAFSVGLAAVLVVIGLLVVWAGRLMARVGADGPLIARWLPLTSSAVMTLFGIAVAVQALVAAGVVQIRL